MNVLGRMRGMGASGQAELGGTTLRSRAWSFCKGLAVGGVATLADWAALAVLIEAGGVAETAANVPALVVGALVQFMGCRHLVFAAAKGSMRRQLVGFTLVELATLALNGIAYHLLVTLANVPYWIARPLGTFGVYVCFSYPMWKWVFRGSLKEIARG